MGGPDMAPKWGKATLVTKHRHNETPQTVDNIATLQSCDNNEGDQSLQNNETNVIESRNNGNLDSSYYSWEKIMQRFKDLPFDEHNSQRILREITEFYRRTMTNAGEVEQIDVH